MSEVRVETLSATTAGMTRLRPKGAALATTLYELTNGYVDASRAPTQRPGTGWAFNYGDPATGHSALAGKTKGLISFKGVFYAFTHSPTFASSGSSTFQILVLRHPTSSTATIAKIHFAQPFMGLMYVVAEFSDALVQHYWLQNPAAWLPNHTYNVNDVVQPFTPTGFYFKAIANTNPPAWSPLLQYNINDVVQPTVYNGWQFIAQQEFGAGAPPARSGNIEPAWIISATGAYTYDFSTSSAPPAAGVAPVAPGQTPPGGGSGGRYSNPYGRNNGSSQIP